MGGSVTIWSKGFTGWPGAQSAACPHLRLKTGSVPAMKTWSRDFSLNSKRTVRASSATTRAMPATAV